MPNAKVITEMENVACTAATLASKYSRTEGRAGM